MSNLYKKKEENMKLRKILVCMRRNALWAFSLNITLTFNFVVRRESNIFSLSVHQARGGGGGEMEQNPVTGPARVGNYRMSIAVTLRNRLPRG